MAIDNPKKAFGAVKVPLSVVPDTAIIEMAMAFLEGALKYGPHNWRVAGIDAKTYHDALRRHTAKWWNGQDRDPVTKVKELASVMACAAILLDAEVCGMLDDNRPPYAPVGQQLEDCLEVVAHLQKLFKDYSPPQYTEKEHGITKNPPLHGAAESQSVPAASAA